MPRAAVIADTHVPSRASGVPEWVEEEVAAADHVIHAGDFDSPEAYETVADLADELTAVAGNMDPDLGLEKTATVELGGLRFVVTHGTGPPHGYRDRVRQTVGAYDGDVGVAGHTHEYLDTVVGGVRLLNPGSATGAAPASETTMLRATVTDGDLTVTRLDAPE